MDQELDDILDNGNMDYLDLTTLAEVEDCHHASSNTFITQLDAGSVSTFGTVKDPLRAKSAYLSRKQSANRTASTVISEMTLDSGC